MISDLNIIKEAAVKQADTFSNRFLPPVLEWTVQDHGELKHVCGKLLKILFQVRKNNVLQLDLQTPK